MYLHDNTLHGQTMVPRSVILHFASMIVYQSPPFYQYTATTNTRQTMSLHIHTCSSCTLFVAQVNMDDSLPYTPHKHTQTKNTRCKKKICKNTIAASLKFVEAEIIF